MAVSRSTTAALMMAPLLLLARTVSAGPAAAADCVAHPTAVVVHGDARFTVLTDRVVRAERAPFVDDCTFTIVRRATPSVPAFTHGLRADGVLEINTTQLRLTFNASAVPRHPPPPPPCLQGCTVRRGVEQAGGEFGALAALLVADEAACCSACATAGMSCTGWVFREHTETGNCSRCGPGNCWTMRTIGALSPSSSGLARTIGTKLPPSIGFPAASLTIVCPGCADPDPWHPGKDDGGANLGGTISSWTNVPPRTLLNGTKTYQPGVLSKGGWAVVDDSATPRFSYTPPLWQGTQPWYAPPMADETAGTSTSHADLYFFGCGHDYKACLQDFVTLSGPVPIPPLATFGVWWSHYETYSEQTIKTDVLDKFLQHELPLNVLQMDCGWHVNGSSANSKCSGYQGYNGYDWNENLFPDPVQFVAAVKSGKLSGTRPLKLLLNTHNFLGMDECQAEYTELKSRLPPPLRNASGPVQYDVTDLATMTGFFDLAMGRNATGAKTRGSRPDYWWHDGGMPQWVDGLLDRGRGYRNTGNSPTFPSPISGPDAVSSGNLFWSVYVHDSHIRHGAAPEANRPMVMPRFGWLGQHRYCCGFSGDQISEWQTLEAEVTMTATAANVGFAHWSHDIGGFHGDPTPELYLRWTQFGALSPMYRSHGTQGSNRDYWSPAYSSVFPMIKQSLALRLALTPYMYTAARHAHDTGVAAVHSLYLDWPSEPQAYTSPGSFMHGPDILVRPITAALSPTTSPVITVPIWLPPSPTGWLEWASASTGVVHGAAASGGTMARARAELGVLPMYVREGAVVPLLPPGSLDATDVADGPGVHWAVFVGAVGNASAGTEKRGNGSRYFDAGDSTAHEGPNGAFATQTFSYVLSSGGPAAARHVRMEVVISAAVANGRFVLPPTKVLHSIEVRGRRAPDTATMGGAAMQCCTVAPKEATLARPARTVVCSGAAPDGLDAPVEAVLEWAATPLHPRKMDDEGGRSTLKPEVPAPQPIPPSPWIKKVHIVSLTHLDVGGYGPDTPVCEDDCKWASDVCNTYFDEYLPAAIVTAEALKAAGKQPVDPGHKKCPPGRGEDHEPAGWYDCPKFHNGMGPGACKAKGCCVNMERYNKNKSLDGWCYPDHSLDDPNTSFVYFTHPWLLQEYFNGSASCGRDLSTRNATALAQVEAAVRAGEISWHAQPFTMITELCDPDIFSWSLNISRKLNSRFGVQHGQSVAKGSDVGGVSIGVVPLLARAGVKALHLGTNGMGNQVFPANITGHPVGTFCTYGGSAVWGHYCDNRRQVFRWRHPATGDEVIMMLEQHYGSKIQLPGFDQVLRFHITSDNGAPPDPEDVRKFWKQTQWEYPNATLQASTVDAFVDELWKVKDSVLPVVTQEIGNVWLPQMGTDPWRFRALRAVGRLRSEWIANGRLAWDDRDLHDYSSALILPLEHNFGMQTGKVLDLTWHSQYWTNSQFHPHMHGADVDLVGFPGLQYYADERDNHIYPKPAAQGASSGFTAFAAHVNATLKQLAHIDGLHAMLKSGELAEVNVTDATAMVLQNTKLLLKFDTGTGAIRSLVEKTADGGSREWVAPGGSLAEFVYRTYTQKADIDPYVDVLTPGHPTNESDLVTWPWSKIGMDHAIEADPAMPPLSNCSRSWPVRLRKAWKSSTTMLLQLALPEKAVTLFGGMSEILLNVTLPADDGGSSAVELVLTWKNKTATRLAESSWLSFVPSVPRPAKGWRLDVLGSPVDPLTVAYNGSRHLHAIHRGVCYDDTVSIGSPDSLGEDDSSLDRGAAKPTELAGTPVRLALESLDVPLVAPGDTAHLINFDNKLPDLAGGFHFNLHNNAGWDQSAPQWYGEDAAFRFRLNLNPGPGCWPKK